MKAFNLVPEFIKMLLCVLKNSRELFLFITLLAILLVKMFVLLLFLVGEGGGVKICTRFVAGE